jgi:alpha-galactosidase
VKYLSCMLFAALLAAQTKDISGTWVGKTQGPMGEMEVVYHLKVADGKITGTQSLPFGDAPIIDGKITGDDIEMIVEMEFFGNAQKIIAKGKMAGDELRITPALPAPPPGFAPPGAPPSTAGGAPGGPPPGGGMPRLFNGPMVFKRGAPTPSYRPGPVDYKSLPVVELPAIKELAWNRLAKTPPMGWNSWNKFRTAVDDKTVREMADAMVSSGMRDAGYQYINIDDGWQWKRDENGVLLPNPGFPDMKALADYVHSKGLKLGIYSSPGPRTCANFEGSYGHEEIDAKTWATWGIDYLKYDWCSASRIWKEQDMRAVYQRMGEALQKSGRPIVYSLCQYGLASVQEWGPAVGGNLWRTRGDIMDQWQSMIGIALSQSSLAPSAKPGSWNDPDMLEVGNGGMTETEYGTHFGLWAIVAAPLIAGNDLRNMDEATRSILLNREVIAINQDPLGKAGHRVSKNGDGEVWAKPLSGGAYAVGLINTAGEPKQMSVAWSDLNVAGAPKVRDVWRQADIGRVKGALKATVPGHGMMIVRVTR